jgi:hypothetical protein
MVTKLASNQFYIAQSAFAFCFGAHLVKMFAHFVLSLIKLLVTAVFFALDRSQQTDFGVAKRFFIGGCLVAAN